MVGGFLPAEDMFAPLWFKRPVEDKTSTEDPTGVETHAPAEKPGARDS